MIRVLSILLISYVFLSAMEEQKYSQELHNAVRSANVDILNHTLNKYDKFINEKDQFGFTPLHLSVRMNDLAMIKALLKFKPNVNTQDSFGDTPIIESARNNNMEIVKLLICAKADKNIKNNHGEGLMDFTSDNKQYKIALFIQEPKCENNTDIDKKAQLIKKLRELE